MTAVERVLERNPWLVRPWAFLVLYTAIAVAITAQKLQRQSFNNFLIFRWSFDHLVRRTDLYAAYPDQYGDFFKYSPTFALFMAPFDAVPVWMGLLVWNLLNALVPLWAVWRLQVPDRAKAFVLLFIAIELIGSIQNAQSNGIVLGLMVGTFAAFERGKPVVAALLVCLGVYIKILGGFAFLLFVMYEGRRTFLFACVVWFALLGAAPALLTGFDWLGVQYAGWLDLLRHDQAGDMNYSIMSIAQRWFGATAADPWYLLPGAVLLVAPLLRRGAWNDPEFRLAYLSSILLWVVIFNHKAESPTFVIAMCGAALWGIAGPPSAMRGGLLVLVFVVTGLSATDLVPHGLKDLLVRQWGVKVIPCILLWAVVTIELLLADRRTATEPRTG